MSDASKAGIGPGAGRLAGKLAIVLGAGGADNIGQAIARAFVAEGASVVVAGRNAAALDTLAAEIGARTALCDITDPVSVERLFTAPRRSIDIAINAVGRSLFRSFMDTDPADIAALSALHLTGPLLFTQSAVRAMPSGGSIIHVSSLSARIVLANHVAYMATKAAGEVLVRAAAFEFGERGIRVNAIAPALTRTPMTEAFFANDELVARSSAAAPLRRLGTTHDVAEAAIWLAQDGCFMTGEVLQINGGMAMHTLAL